MIIYFTNDGAQIDPVDNAVNCGDNCHKAIALALKDGNSYIETTCLAQVINEINHQYIYKKAPRAVVAYVRCLIEDLKMMRRMGSNCAVTPEPLSVRKLDKHDARGLYKKAP